MAAKKTKVSSAAKSRAAVALGDTTLLSALNSIMEEVGVSEARSFRPVPTGIDVLDYYNARYFNNHETKGWEMFSGMPMGKLIMKIGYTGSGKAQPVDSIIYTPTGKRRIGDIVAGDLVMNRDGKPVPVHSVHPQGEIPVYRMTFTDGTSTLCAADHLWTVRDKSLESNAWVTVPTSSLMGDSNLVTTDSYKWEIPLCKPVEYSTKDLPVHPYVFGVLMASGGKDVFNDQFVYARVTYDIVEKVARLIPDGYTVTTDSSDYGTTTTGIISCDGDANIAFNEAIALKTIPDIYKFGSVFQRHELLRGLMDITGVIFDDRVYFTSPSEQLTHDVIELVQSLGGTAEFAITTSVEDDIEYIAIIKMTINPFYCAICSAIWRNKVSIPTRFIESIICEGVADQVCIYLEDESHLYLTNDYIVTHNTTLTVQEGMALVAPYASGTVFHFDLENAWSDERTADITGLSIDEVKAKYKRFKPVPLETIYSFVKKIINTKTEMMQDPNSEIWVVDERTGERVPTPTVIIIDTIAALQSKQVLEDNEEMGSLLYEAGAQAKANNAFAQRLAGMIGDPNITIYAVNHIRVDPGPSGGPPKPKRVQYLAQDETCPGGTGFPQFSDYFLKMVPCESLTNKMDEGMAIPGKIIRCTIVKSRLSYDGRQFEVVLTANGISNAWTNLNFLRVTKSLKGAGAHLFVEAPDGRVTQKFAMRNWEGLYEGDATFRDIADACIGEELLKIVPPPGAASAPDAIPVEG